MGREMNVVVMKTFLNEECNNVDNFKEETEALKTFSKLSSCKQMKKIF